MFYPLRKYLMRGESENANREACPRAVVVRRASVAISYDVAIPLSPPRERIKVRGYLSIRTV